MGKRHIGAVLLAVAGVINAAPGTGALSAERIRSAYGLEEAAAADPDLAVLLRHRAVLFLVTGGLLLVAVARPHLRTAAVVTNATSSAAFVVLAVTAGPVGAPLVRIAAIDVVVLGLLAGGTALLRPAPDPGEGPGGAGLRRWRGRGGGLRPDADPAGGSAIGVRSADPER